jgi:N-acetyl sugar amidotransferase
VKSKTNKVCTTGLWDDTMPGIVFDETGESNYAKIFRKIMEYYPRGPQGENEWETIVSNIKASGKNKKYDCIIGVSGGTDSSYLLHIAIESGLRPLAVNLDNGWSSDISVKNIKKLTSILNIDLETYVIDYEEIKDILKSYMKASLPWVDNPTDQAIKAILYKKAYREGIKFVLIGHDFRSEGFQPKEWTYGDSRQLRFLQKCFGKIKLKTFPYLKLSELAYYGVFKKIKLIRPFFYIDYEKRKAQKFLIDKYGWEYYGGHHHENIFTRFVISDWLPNKFKIDKRKITLSAQILSNEITREEGIKELSAPPYSPELMKNDRNYVLKKLDLDLEEFSRIWELPNRTFIDYPSYYPTIKKFSKISTVILSRILPNKPLFLFQMEERKE